MTTLDWPTFCADTIKLFRGDRPNQQQEDDVLAVWTANPQGVALERDRVADGLARGDIHNPWHILRVRAMQSSTWQPQQAVASAPMEDDRSKAIERADRWMRNAGLHFDRIEEVLDELFVSGGPDRGGPLLAAWKGDAALEQHVVKLWEDLRPAGVRTEREAERRAENWKRTRAKVKAAKGARTPAEMQAFVDRISSGVKGLDDDDLEAKLPSLPSSD